MSNLSLTFDDPRAVGLVVQALGALLIAVLCLMLNRIANAKALTAWGRGWVSLGIGLLSLLVQQTGTADERITLPMYLFAEYLFGYWLIEGCAIFGDRHWPAGMLKKVIVPCGAAAIVFPKITGYEFGHIFILQSTVLSIVFAVALGALTSPTRIRSSPGMTVMRAALGLLAILFLAYVPIFGANALLGIPLPMTLLKCSSILHLLLEFQLGFAGALLILEQTNQGLIQQNSSLHFEAAEYRGQAERDALTNAYTRRALLKRLSAVLLEAEQSGTSVSLLYCDLDNFTQINDLHGQTLGDQLLVTVAKRLDGCIGRNDLVVRMGSDEFFIVANNIGTEPSSVFTWAEYLQNTVNKTIVIREHEVNMGLSVGVSTFPVDGRDASSLLQRANIALYQAKAIGLNTCQLFNETMNEQNQRRAQLTQDLRLSIGTDQLFLVYQPIMNLQLNVIIGLEALIRWNHPKEGIVSPAEFIPLAESSGLMTAIGEYVLMTVCREINRWKSQFIPVVPIAVNISSRQFERGRLADRVISIVNGADVDPALIRLEITESGLVSDAADDIATLTRLRNYGFKISVDDFGTGYSNLSYLKNLPIDCLKIDRTFISDITVDKRNAAVVQAVVTIAQSMHLEVIAEGVETSEQAAALKSLGCFVAQGYFYHKPMTALECQPLLAGFTTPATLPAPRASPSRKYA